MGVKSFRKTMLKTTNFRSVRFDDRNTCPEREGVDAVMQASLNRAFEEFATEGVFSGVALVRQNGRDLLSRAFGYASRAWGIPNTLSMRFAHASAGKMFTAVSILQLAERGLLQLDQPVGGILDLKGSAIPGVITVAQLLSHTSGIADYFDEEHDGSDAVAGVWAGIPNYSIRGPGDLMPMFASMPPLFEPGIRFSYCNAGYILLGLIVEQLSGTSYFEYVRQNIFRPAGMAGSDFIPLDTVVADRADGHIPVAGPDARPADWRTNIFAVPAHGAPDGGAYTTAHDFARFLETLRDGKFLSHAMLQEMLVPRVAQDGTGNGEWWYGYGLMIQVSGDCIVRYGHPGEDPGASARIYHFPEQRADMVVLGNQSGCAGSLAAKLAMIITGSGLGDGE